MAADINPGLTNPGPINPGPMHNGRTPDANSAVNLLSRLVDDMSALFRNEVALAKAELAQATARAKAGLASMATGAAVLLAGVLALVAAAILALAEVVEPWLAALIVGAVLTGVGVAMVMAGRKKVEPSAFALERTQASLRRDTEVVRRAT